MLIVGLLVVYLMRWLGVNKWLIYVSAFAFVVIPIVIHAICTFLDDIRRLGRRVPRAQQLEAIHMEQKETSSLQTQGASYILSGQSRLPEP